MLTLGRRTALTGLGLATLVAGCSGSVGEAPVFCYRWLADVTCYAEPQADADARLLGVYLRDLDDPSEKAYWLARARARMSR
jgi:hypothetical protein